jgi:opacity protein-like surface antigen
MRQHYKLMILLAVLSMNGNALAQTERFEFFTGYSALRNFSSGAVQHFDTMHGWNISLTMNIKPWIGITADFGGNYNGRRLYLDIFFVNDEPVVGYREYKFMIHRGMVGPKVKLRNGRWEPFSHALFGVSRVSNEAMPPSTEAGHETGFAWALGGGLDLNLSERVKMRLIQADYMRSRTSLGGEGLRASFGLVFPL